MFAKFLFLAIMYGIYWVCYQVLLKDVEKKTKIKIKSLKRKSSLEAIALRKRLQKRRTILLIGIVFVSASVLASLAIFTDSELMSGTVDEVIVDWLICFFLGCFICSIPIKNNSKIGDEFFGNISLLTIDDVLSENKPFYLYLRGFDFDDRRTHTEILESTYDKGFSEYLFVKGLKKQIKRVYAVGRPEETDSPIGATRVYLDNERWRDDVTTLMNLSKRIYVRACYTDDCSWELENAISNHMDKTVILVDNKAEYNLIRESISIELPEINDYINEWTIVLLSKSPDAEWDIESYKKRGTGYVKVSDKTDDGKPLLPFHKLKYIIIGILILFFVVVIKMCTS